MSDDSGRTDASDVFITFLELFKQRGVQILVGFVIVLFGAWAKIDRVEEFIVNIINATLHGN